LHRAIIHKPDENLAPTAQPTTTITPQPNAVVSAALPKLTIHIPLQKPTPEGQLKPPASAATPLVGIPHDRVAKIQFIWLYMQIYLCFQNKYIASFMAAMAKQQRLSRTPNKVRDMGAESPQLMFVKPCTRFIGVFLP
jgi:hypothetical protein